MSYGTEPQAVDVPLPFQGTDEQKRANYETHNWVQESITEVICSRCGAYIYMVASDYPCGEEPPRTIIFKQFT
jgi:hypothetical protein